MAKPKIGDIVEIPLTHGFAYALYTHKHAQYGALLRVFRTHERSRPSDHVQIVDQAVAFSCFFPLSAALTSGIVSVIGNAPIPEELQAFPIFRAGVPDPASGKVAVWWLWDGQQEWRVDQLTEEQRTFPIRGVWNDTLLKERIESGWAADADIA